MTVKSIAADHDLGAVISPDRQLLEIFLIADDQPLLVGEMQQRNETETRTDFRHLLFGVHLLEVIDHVCESERSIALLRCGQGKSRGILCLFVWLAIRS